MSTWQLFMVNSDETEAVDTVNLQTDIYEEAHTYFRLRKNLDSEVFNKLFIVKEYKKELRPIARCCEKKTFSFRRQKV